MEELLKRLQKHYGLSEEDLAVYLREPSFAYVPTIEGYDATKSALRRIKDALLSRERILIYGDYDTDGIMATSILVRSFHLLRRNVSFFIPSRYKDGYGLTMDNAKKIADSGYKLLICVDNGIASVDEISYLLSRGVNTIVIDHHEPLASLPPATAIIHDDTLHYGVCPVSAGYLSFLFSICLLGRVDDYLLTLGAISTISDMMPLKGHNREIVRLALRNIKANNYPEISYLCDKSRIDEKTISMEIIPKINAVGRMELEHKTNRLVHYFSDLENTRKSEIADWMNTVNNARKEATKAAFDKLEINPVDAGICVVGNLPEGLNGLLANKLLNAYHKPTVVFSPSIADPSVYTGSLRSSEGFNVMKALDALSPYVVKGGGHAFAGGVSIKKKDFPAFKEEFLRDALEFKMEKKEKDLIPLSLSEVNLDSFSIIRSLAPYGMEFEEPEFLIENLPTDSFQYTRDSRFLSSPLGYGCKLLSFSFGKKDVNKPRMSLVGKFCLSEYKGKASLDFVCAPKEE